MKKRKVFKISDEQIKEMYLSGSSMREIAEVAQDNIGLMAIRRKLQELGVDTTRNMKRYSQKFSDAFRKYKLDETVFDCIDTEEKAYWLGFLFADGYNNEAGTAISLRLQEEDEEILEKFKEFLKTDKEIKRYSRVTKTNKLKRNYCELYINSVRLSKRLAELGCVKNKTYIVEFPSFLPNHLIRHFIRGYFDGDGCISCTERKDRRIRGKSMNIQFTITGRPEFISVCQENICQATGIHRTKLNTVRNNFAASVHYGGKCNITKIFKYLYSDSNIYMERKYKKFISIVSR